ncbi:hypothetical protein NQ318_014466 [Aromia moschata]|uniref:Uncharacterized protein n=1 Tax=Aromia moschata TaxID=1265417 RepID=A0AAV8YN76_9CUCU|nr:hypothetical protein NQ318_014466 [Aromia moschata]
MFQLHYGSVYGTFMTGHLPILVIKRKAVGAVLKNGCAIIYGDITSRPTPACDDDGRSVDKE